MSMFPEILPAHPAAPETQRHQPRKVKYGILGRLMMFIEVTRERRELAHMDDKLLRDIGLTRDEARHEVDRPFWDVPKGWRNAERGFSRPGLL